MKREYFHIADRDGRVCHHSSKVCIIYAKFSGPVCSALLLLGNLARKFPMMIDLTGHEVSNIVDLDFLIERKASLMNAFGSL